MGRMPTRVLLTVDTELTSRHYRRGASWHENFERSHDPAGVGIPYQLRVLAEHKLKACFFVDPMPALVYGLDPIKRIVDAILDVVRSSRPGEGDPETKGNCADQ